VSPDQIYGKANGVEIAVIATDAFVQTEDEEWRCFEDVTGYSLEEFGFNPPDVGTQLDIDGLVEKAVFLPDQTLNGFRVHHVQATLDPIGYVKRVRALMGAQGQLDATLDSVSISRITIDAFVDADLLMRRIKVDVKMEVDGIGASVLTETTLSDFDEPFELPLQEPYPTCGSSS
jgi:hypothetical protein